MALWWAQVATGLLHATRDPHLNWWFWPCRLAAACACCWACAPVPTLQAVNRMCTFTHELLVLFLMHCWVLGGWAYASPGWHTSVVAAVACACLVPVIWQGMYNS